MKENKKIKNIKVVLLDLDNTTWIHRKDEIKLVARTFKIPELEEFEKQYFGMFAAFGDYFEDRTVSYCKIMKVINNSMPILSKYGITAKEFLEKWIPIETSFLNEDALEAMKYLKEKKCKIVVLTDWLWECQVPLLKKYGLMPYVDKIYTCDGQYLKKNPKSAARVIEAGHEEDYVIIGDSLKDDIAFGNHAGIKSIWYNPEGKKNETIFKPTLEIDSMLELCRIIA